MSFSWGRVGAIFRKELRDYRRNRFVILTMAFFPLLFVILPTIQLLLVAAYCVVGEREQGTLEPVLITPIHREEFLVGKALAVLVPTLGIAYLVFGIFLGVAAIFAQPGAASAVFEGSHLLVQLLFTPLLAGWSIWAGIAISARSADVRAAQQLGVLASLPPLVIVALMSFNVIVPTLGLVLGLAGALLLVDALGWRAVAAMFDRERLITGTRS